MILLGSCGQDTEKRKQQINSPLLGEWIRMGHQGPVSFHFKADGTVEADINNDDQPDVFSGYSLSGDTILFHDREGKLCASHGKYLMNITPYYVSFNLLDDTCMGRVRSTMGYWTKPGYVEILEQLSNEIDSATDAGLFLHRARIYLAMGKAEDARSNLNVYINHNHGNDQAYVNRAATFFPGQLQEAVEDCNHAIAINPENKNAYFLRGLALYDLGEEKRACADFKEAIRLGFTVLKKAEQNKCSEYWNETSMPGLNTHEYD